jgi:hypothetical protein
MAHEHQKAQLQPAQEKEEIGGREEVSGKEEVTSRM